MKHQAHIPLYRKQTDGGAEYLCLTPITGTTIGDITTAVIRLDGQPCIPLHTEHLLTKAAMFAKQITQSVGEQIDRGVRREIRRLRKSKRTPSAPSA